MRGECDYLYDMPDDACIACGERGDNCKCPDETLAPDASLPQGERVRLAKPEQRQPEKAPQNQTEGRR
jgi:hypothetical protein